MDRNILKAIVGVCVLECSICIAIFAYLSVSLLSEKNIIGSLYFFVGFVVFTVLGIIGIRTLNDLKR